MTVIRIVGLVNGWSSPFDGQYIVEYDANRSMPTPGGAPDMVNGWPHLVTTPDRSKAREFSFVEAHACWTQVDERHPVRPDGKPNRPLTAFTVEFLS